MNLQFETYKIQSDFSAYCRTGNLTDLPGVNPDGVKQYRRLIFGVVRDAIENSYPIALDYIHREIWDEMLNDFFGTHKCQSYQVWNIAGEFFEYAVSNDWAKQYKLPLLNNLLQFEWAETEMYNMPDEARPSYAHSGDMMHYVPVFNPEFRIYQFEYPVHKMRPEQAATHRGRYFMLMFRDHVDGRIHFMDLSVFWVWMIEQMDVQGKTTEQSLETARSMFGEIDLENKRIAVKPFLTQLNDIGFLLGFKKISGTN